MQASRRPRWPMVVGWHALVKAALRAPPVAASALTRTWHPTFVATHEFDGGVRLIQQQMPCQVFSWRQIYSVSDSRSHLRQAALKGAEDALRPAPGFRRKGRDQLDAEPDQGAVDLRGIVPVDPA